MKHVPKHRGAPATAALAEAPRKAFRTTLVMSSVAVAATGVTVGGGLLGSSPSVGVAASATGTADQAGSTGSTGATGGSGATLTAAQQRSVAAATLDRGLGLNRSFDRSALPRATAAATPDAATDKAAVLSTDGGPAVSGQENLADAAPTDIAKSLLGQFGWDQSQFGCLDSLWTRESGWNVHAENPSSGAYGIPQSLPGSKMASIAPDWQTNPVTQITWGLTYIQERYGSPCGAWSHSEATGFY